MVDGPDDQPQERAVREQIAQAVEAALGATVQFEGHGTDGGSGASTATVILGRRDHAFLKWWPQAPADFFAAEAAGLHAIAATAAVRVPNVLAVGPTFVVTELIREGRRGRGYFERLGGELAQMHRASASANAGAAFGHFRQSYCGASPQPNPDTPDFWDFYAQHRLLHQLRLLGVRAPTALRDDVESAAHKARSRWGDLGEPPSLVHGDLWGGNAMVGAKSEPVLVDPACHYAIREVDLAMTELFGGFSPTFYAAYQAAWPLAPGYAERREFYHLYHLLNHATLFGGTYAAQAAAVARRFA